MQVLAQASSSRCVWSGPDRDAAEVELWRAVDACLAACGCTYDDVVALCAAPTTRTDDDLPAAARSIAARMPTGVPQLVYSDAVAALASGTGGVLQGCVLVADEHALVYGIEGGDAPREARSSGWGPLFGDGGGAFDIGMRVLQAVAKAHDGRGAHTSLVHLLARRLSLRNADDLVRWAQFPTPPSNAEIAALAQVVVEAALTGDAVADTILRHGVGELFHAVRAVATALGYGGSGGTGYNPNNARVLQVVFAGRMLRENSLYANHMAEALREQMPYVNVIYPRVEPAVAASLLAHQAWERYALPETSAPQPPPQPPQQQP